MTKFKVGDKVRVIDASYSEHSNGDIGEIVGITLFMSKLMHVVDVDGLPQGHYEKDLELAEVSE